MRLVTSAVKWVTFLQIVHKEGHHQVREILHLAEDVVAVGDVVKVVALVKASAKWHLSMKTLTIERCFRTV